MATVDSRNLAPYVLQPQVNATGSLNLDVVDTSQNVPSGDDARDNFDEENPLETVQVQIRDDGAVTMTVTTIGGSVWARNEGATPKYSYKDIAIPDVDLSNTVQVSIAAAGATTRNQVIIIRRITVF